MENQEEKKPKYIVTYIDEKQRSVSLIEAWLVHKMGYNKQEALKLLLADKTEWEKKEAKQHLEREKTTRETEERKHKEMVDFVLKNFIPQLALDFNQVDDCEIEGDEKDRWHIMVKDKHSNLSFQLLDTFKKELETYAPETLEDFASEYEFITRQRSRFETSFTFSKQREERTIPIIDEERNIHDFKRISPFFSITVRLAYIGKNVVE